MLGCCEEPRLSLSQLNDGTDRRRFPVQDKDHSGNDTHLVPGFLPLCSEIFPERFRSVSVPVGSRGYRLVRRSAQNAELCPAEFLEQFFSDSAFNLFKNLCYIFLIGSGNGRDP